MTGRDPIRFQGGVIERVVSTDPDDVENGRDDFSAEFGEGYL